MNVKDLILKLVEDYQLAINRQQQIIDKDGGVKHKLELFSGAKPSKGLNPQVIVTEQLPEGADTKTQERCWVVELYMNGLPLIKDCATTVEGASLKELEPILMGRILNIIFAAGIGNLVSLKRSQN